MNILILGSKSDPHVELIKVHLESHLANVDILDIYGQPDLDISFGEAVDEITLCGRKISAFSAILNRMKWRWDPFTPDEPAYLEYFHNFEWVYLLRGVMMASRRLGVPVINGPLESFEGGNKIVQLLLAKEAGLEIPSTNITTRPSVISDMKIDYRPRIAKVFEASFVPAMGGQDAKAIFTTRVRAEDVAQLADAACDSPPMLIQTEIRKAFEARLVISQAGSACYRINSQKEVEALVDWRRVEFGMTYELFEAPPWIVECSVKLLHALGLDYGVLDFAVTDAGQWVFFECNPDGQWWLARHRGGGKPERVIGDVVLARAAATRPSVSSTI